MGDEADTFNDAIRAEHAGRQQALADRLVPPPPDPDPDNPEGEDDADR
jgi:hypothetical protein